MKSVRDRYLTDATFHHVVDSMRALISGAQLTPSEVRAADEGAHAGVHH